MKANDDDCPPTPQKDIDRALSIEKAVTAAQMPTYLEWMDGKPMSERTSGWDIRDGCILTGLYIQCGINY